MNRGKTIMYFDNSNIFHGQKDVGWRLDAVKLMSLLQKDGPIWQSYFFAAVTDPPHYSQTNFYKMLKDKLRWEMFIFPLGFKTIKCRSCQSIKKVGAEKGVDVAIATKMLSHAINKAFDTAILISGDKDYLETVKQVKNMGNRVEIVTYRHSGSSDLCSESSGPVIYLDDYKTELELKIIDKEAEELEDPNIIIEETANGKCFKIKRRN